MEWFNTWWQGLGLAGQIMACAAVPATVVMLLQLILTLLGAQLGDDFDTDFDGDLDADFDGGIDTDLDADFDADFETDLDTDFDGDIGADIDGDTGVGHGGEHGGDGIFGGVKLFTVRGVTAFFAIGGWAGIAALSCGLRLIWSLQIALLAGALAMLTASAAIRLALKMQSDGNIRLKNAINRTATVYMTIPPSRVNTGKVTLLLQDRFTELDAVTDCDTELKPNTTVVITGVAETPDGTCLIVRPAEVCDENGETEVS